MSESDEHRGARDRRRHERYETSIQVDYDSGDESFLFAYIENISEMGIFIRTEDPLPVGTELTVRFRPNGTPLRLDGDVVWINPLRDGGDNLNPGMGVRFHNLTPEQREQIVEVVRTVAYLQGDGGGQRARS